MSARTWVLVLAAGDGTRLAALTSGAGGHVPKQFCSFCSDRSLLAQTLDRARALAPRERIAVVVAAGHRAFWQRELAQLPPGNVVVQPANRGTAAGLLLGALRVQQLEPQATVAVLPSDHFFDDEGGLRNSLLTARDAAATWRRSVVLLGMTPDAPDEQYGWIVPTADGDGLTTGVQSFVEKPRADVAARLMRQGALWSSFILVARLAALLAVYERSQPALLAAFREGLLRPAAASHPAAAADALYARLPPRDFSRDVLQSAADSLRLLAVPALGWSDLGTPERLRQCLQRVERRAPGAARERDPGDAWPQALEAALQRAERARNFAHSG